MEALYNRIVEKIQKGIIGTEAKIDSEFIDPLICIITVSLNKFNCHFNLQGRMDDNNQPLINMSFDATNYNRMNTHFITNTTLDEIMDGQVRLMQESYVKFAF